jgi:VWFA-related protein
MAFRSLLIAASGALLLAQAPTFRVATRLIQVNVIVTNHKGEPVTGLTKDQFTVFDQGRAQKIAFFTEQTNQPRPAAQLTTVMDPHVFSNRPEETAGAPGSVTVVLFDALNTNLEDSAFARARVSKFLEGVQPQDHIALYGLSSRLLILHDFTQDASALVRALDRFRPAQSAETAATTFKESSTGDANMDAAANDLNQRVSDAYMKNRVQHTAEALEAIANHLAGLPGRKNLVWVSGSFPISIGFFQKRLMGAHPQRNTFGEEVDAAGRALSNASVAIYPVDAHGLTALADFNAATGPRPNVAQLSRPRPPEFAPIADLETMDKLAAATGGRVFVNTNDIAGAVRRAIDDSRCTYTLSYYPDHDQWDGKFREIKVRVNHPGVEVRARSGYLAFPQATRDAASAMNLSELAARPLESSELGLSVQFEPAALHQFKAHLSVDTTAMRFEQKDGIWIGELEVLWVQFDANGKSVGSHGGTVNLRLSPEAYATAAREGLKLSSIETIDEKATQLRFAARDPESGAAGSLHLSVRSLTEP